MSEQASKSESQVAASQLVAELARQYQSAATELIQSGQAWAGVLILCCGIDALAAFHSGRSGQSSSSKDFVSFVDQYVPVFAQGPPGETWLEGSKRFEGRLAWASRPGQPVSSCAEILYRGYKCGLIHQGVMSPGINVVDVPASLVFIFEVDYLDGEIGYKMSLNVRPFLDAFVNGIEAYVRALSESKALDKRFWRRWNSLAGPQWAIASQIP